MPPAHFKYVVNVPHVQEVSLHATADLDFWREKLKPEGVAPRDDQGRAELLFIAAHMRWMGVWFSELSISVALADSAPGQMFLIHAFNSIPVFAWSERLFFKTPYYPGQTRVTARAPAGMELALGGATCLSAAMAEKRAPARSGDETWEGGILLPRQLSRTPRAEKYFVARLSGPTEIYPFAPTDTLTLAPDPAAPILGWLHDSHVTGKEWHLRPDATHAKSETLSLR